MRLWIQETILIVFADMGVDCNSIMCMLHVTDGFIKGPMASQVD